MADTSARQESDEQPRLRLPDHAHAILAPVELDKLLDPDHQARLVWQFVGSLDLSALLAHIHATTHRPGRNHTDPRLLVGLWLLATLDGIGSARELDRLCREHLAYLWLCGGVTLNYHTLSDFRVDHEDLLDQLLTDAVTVLLRQGLVSLSRIAQDGMRVRASAGADSFHRQPTLEECRRQAEQHLAALKQQQEPDPAAASRRQKAARERAARERWERVQQALQQLPEVQAAKEAFKKGTAAKARTSTTDPDARTMKMPDGGFRPAYNVQFATDVTSKVIVGVTVTKHGSDKGQLLPMVEQIEARYDRGPGEVLADGDFAKLEDIEVLHREHQTEVYSPVKNADKEEAAGKNPYEPKKGDKPGMAAWRVRMGTEAGQTIYRQRAETAELVNAQARNRGLYAVRVRGLQRVRCIALWYALAHLVMRASALRPLSAGQQGSNS
jgi:transposase